MYSINHKQVTTFVVAILLSGCSQQLPLLPEVIPLPVNSVCKHEFTDAQRNLKPSFVETETNSIVGGNTLQTLMRSISTTAEYQGQGNTHWTITWSFDSGRSAAGCAIKNIQTNVEVDYHLPLWPEQINVENRTLAVQWNQYSDALRAHHCKHGKAGIAASLEVKSRLQRLDGFARCDTLLEEADSMARSVINVYKKAEAGFTPPQIFDYIQR